MSGIGSWLTKREIVSPHKEAIVDGEIRLTYAQLNRRVNRLANGLASLGLSKGDRIGMLSYNRAEFIEVIMATAKLGLILVPLNWRLAAQELAFILTDSGTKTLIFDSELDELAGQISTEVEFKSRMAIGSDYEALLASQSENKPAIEDEIDLVDPHIIMYTAGTTGKPKGAILSQGASLWNALNLQVDMEFTSIDRDLLVLPMFHIGGIGLFTLPMLYVGGTVVIQRVFEPVETLRLLTEERISLFFGVPAIFLFLIQHPEFKAEAFEMVRLVMSGGAPLPVSLVKNYYDQNIILQQGFGMSEAAPSIATLSKEKALAKAGAIGQPVFHLQVRIVDEQGRELPSGQVGELVMRGPNIMQGYWNRPQATTEAFEGGWFHSGDLARIDDDGDLFIVDRKKDMFISGGENVYPAEVENAMFELEGVAEAALIGVSDDRWGEVGLAVVAVKDGDRVTEEQMIGHLKDKLAKYKIPKSIVFVDALPRNAAGKVLKNVLRKEYS